MPKIRNNCREIKNFFDLLVPVTFTYAYSRWLFSRGCGGEKNKEF